MNKVDMSNSCQFKDAEMHYKAARREITQDEYDKWYESNCGRCIYYCEICMCGEEVK